MPRLGNRFPIEIEVTSKPIADYQTDAYFELDLPVAPAVMVGDEIVVEGSGIDGEQASRRPSGGTWVFPSPHPRRRVFLRTPVPQVRAASSPRYSPQLTPHGARVEPLRLHA